MANDIQNLLNRFGASSERYLEVEDFPEYQERSCVQTPPPCVTKEPSHQTAHQGHLLAMPEQIAALPRALSQPQGASNIGDCADDEKMAEGLAFGTTPLLDANTSPRAAVDEIRQVLSSRLDASRTHGYAL